MAQKFTTIPVTPSTLDRVRALKRGGETYDDVVARMADQYQPSRSAPEGIEDA